MKQISWILFSSLIIALLLLINGCTPRLDNLPDPYGKRSSYYISKDKKHIYARYCYYAFSFRCTYKMLNGVDASKFIVLGYDYGKDDKHIIYDGKIISVFWDDDEIQADLETLHTDKNGVLKDKNHVYYRHRWGRWQVMKEADANTVESLIDLDEFNNILRDNKNYFYHGERIPVKDYDSFTFLRLEGPVYGRDKYHVYIHVSWKAEYHGIGWTIIEDVNPDSFEIIEIMVEGNFNVCWARDDKHYYYNGERSDIDYETFEVVGYFEYVMDKDHVYKYGKITDESREEIMRKARERKEKIEWAAANN